MLELLPKNGRPDLISGLIADKRSENTKRAYQGDLEHFFQTMGGRSADPQAVYQFLQLERHQANQIVMNYKAIMLEQGKAEATVNRRLASLKSLTKYARKVGACHWDLSDVEGEKVKSYRDTSGITAEEMQTMFETVNQSTVKGIRDLAILQLFWENALRRGEITKTSVKDFEGNNLWILGKGKGTQKEAVSLSPQTCDAIREWLAVYSPESKDEPLFPSMNKAGEIGGRMSGEGISKLVQKYAKKAGIEKKITPHRLRHSSITAALEATNGNVALVRQLSRHAKVETLMIYEDRRGDEQKKVTNLLANLIQPKGVKRA